MIKTFYYFAGSVSNSTELESYDPIGVVAICGYYDSPLLSVATKLAAALATGNSCVLIPHYLTPFSAYLLAEICAQSGVPKGVVSVISSSNNNVYDFVASNPLVNCVTYDGKTNVFLRFFN